MDFNIKDKDLALKLFVDAQLSLQQNRYEMYVAQVNQAMTIAEKVFDRERTLSKSN